jgi:hypothetical protein
MNYGNREHRTEVTELLQTSKRPILTAGSCLR